ncbi:GNAT family N-acetyltransferase [Streptomyces sp. ISL-43]|uniref:GNAT family N-acetyltransferase n=1 Tax=Streptomyces sp. ISL-43 TaxID=2819183 RepID=UPI001BED39D9|nr:GNAT family N-acetyltransferase [Streptomyces sp. ISL-43]MBT2450990.1 GNAT family N-acetyltransferase [Streptomyces sp. ISL-43]
MVRFGKGDPRVGADALSCVAAVDDDGRLVGGVRVHHGVEGELPSEIHLRSPHVASAVARARARGEAVAELSGAWVAPHWRGRHLVTVLVVAGIAAAETLGATALLGSCSDRLTGTYERCGYRWRREQPLADVPLPGVTSYYSLDRIEAFHQREARLTRALRSLRQELGSTPERIPEPVLRACVDQLGLRLFEPAMLSPEA